MVTSVGRTYADSCASIRAGFVRPSPISDYELLDPETQDLVPLIGYPVPVCAGGFDMVGRWLMIGAEAMRDLIRNISKHETVAADFWRNTLLIGVSPRLDAGRLQTANDEDPGKLVGSYLNPMCRQLDLPIPPQNVRSLAVGRTGLYAAIQHGRTELEEGRARRVVVLAVDSLLDSLSLEWLDSLGRLKSDVNPTGLVPAEAGVAICLDLASTKTEQPELAVIEKTSSRNEVDEFFATAPRIGVPFSTVLGEVTDSTGDQPFMGPIVCDLNGETWRAFEFSNARLRQSTLVTDQTSIEIPAVSTGDTGAASAALGLAYGISALGRFRGAYERFIVASSSEFGPVGAARVTRPQHN
ncbi:MAG: hypothetical protein HKN13_12650 [Rhodothermales bacterium]|nr:hypothetical protein [Rhodothermales bacterium]